MSKAAAKISLASTKWQPDSILNRAAYDGSFSENELFAKVQFIEPQPPIFRKPVAAVLGQAPEGESDGLSEKDTSSSTGNDKESAGLAEQVGAKDQSSRSAMPNISPALPILDQDSLRQEYDRGFDAGVQAARAEARKSIELEKHGVREFLVALNESLANPRDFFVPMESLAIHIAEQLVRGELSLSGTAIRRLVENALMEIGRPGQKVTVRLNPDDLDKFSMLDSELSDLMTLVRDSGLSRGSVRLEMSGGGHRRPHREPPGCDSSLGTRRACR